MWWKKNKFKIIAPVLIVVVLAIAYFAGGDIPSDMPPDDSAAAENPEAVVTTTPAPLPTPTPIPTPKPTPTPTQEPVMEHEPEASPEPTPEALPAEEDDTLSCTIYIRCDTILNNMELCDPAKADIVPVNGWILGNTEVEFSEGETVFDVLLRVCREKGIHMEYMDSPIYDSAYIEGIANIYEFDVGSLSGWMYKVNGWYPNYGCSRYVLSDGDFIGWVYTCDMGADVGGSNF